MAAQFCKAGEKFNHFSTSRESTVSQAWARELVLKEMET